MNTALVTGASGSIGFAISDQLVSDGFDVILLGRSLDPLESAKKKLRTDHPGRSVEIQLCDVRQPTGVRRLFESLTSRDVTLAVLVNCAGISGGGHTAEISDALWADVMSTNLNGTFYVIRDALQLSRIAPGGRIINIASTGGKQGVIHAAPYSASKHGVVGLTKAIGLELARNGSGITVNAVCPGFVESDMAERVREHYASIWGTSVDEARRRIEERVPLGRYIAPDEVAAMVSYLASPRAAGVTAQALNVCGGLGNY
ncbi:SDR family NAD(P)-dependent oxidoreductase [Nocardia terpenica]|uniref:3-oxoacyl-[acyl-carrier-protein] reductase MabA n=1 Tax=Nocardia terpenica TaxID=455432 RepID=A0A291RGK2_9NOCA|nr:SDR family NAD(P)-dependent oxidoreductase [Nocardia terpenica]ATL66254.1 ketoacyl reductase [Nocardia terpenica]